jgi:hypothetical protein
MKVSPTDPKEIITLVSNGAERRVERGQVSGGLVRFVFDDGDVVYMPELEVLRANVRDLKKLIQAHRQSEQDDLTRARQKSIGIRREGAQARDPKIRDDVKRLKSALDKYQHYDRKALPPLLREFGWQGNDPATFKASQINALVGKKYELTARRVGQILKAPEIC